MFFSGKSQSISNYTFCIIIVNELPQNIEACTYAFKPQFFSGLDLFIKNRADMDRRKPVLGIFQ